MEADGDIGEISLFLGLLPPRNSKREKKEGRKDGEMHFALAAAGSRRSNHLCAVALSLDCSLCI